MEYKYLNANGEKLTTIKYSRNANGTTKTADVMKTDGKVMWGSDNYTYYENGLLKNLHYNVSNGEKSDRTSADIQYKYDEHGNWIERRQGSWLLIERIIKYYD